MSKFQPSSCWHEVKLKNFEVLLLFDYPIHFVQYYQSTGGKTMQSTMNPWLCCTVFLGLKVSPLLLQTHFVGKYLNLSIIRQQNFSFQKTFSLSVWTAVNFRWACVFILEQGRRRMPTYCKTHFIVVIFPNQLILIWGWQRGGEMQQRATSHTGTRAGHSQPCGIWSTAYPTSALQHHFMYACLILSLCGWKKIPNKSKLVHDILTLKVILIVHVRTVLTHIIVLNKFNM